MTTTPPNPNLKGPNQPVLESILLALKLKQYKYLRDIIKEQNIRLDDWDHAIIKALGSDGGYSNKNKEALCWVLEKGEYKTKHPEIALCIYSQCDRPQGVKELLEQGCEATEPPWKGAQNAAEFAIYSDSKECLELLTKTCSQRELEKLLSSCALNQSPECALHILKEINKPTPIAKEAWETWEKYAKTHNDSHLPEKLAQKLAQKIATLDIQELLGKTKPTQENNVHLKILSQELQKRLLKEKVSTSKTLEI